ncbi:MAG TPA: large-conductance mechanosensitive channel protein MscL [Nevskia sp.]|jgi:large conductance mechanosensitive channel|nr:large-conductance mechanosensitive channel protein MscL [Nevskia sp.]
MSMLKEFREFAMKGNVVDLAVGVIIGGAFGKIVSSLVADVFMPVLGLITGGINFSDMAITLKAASADGKTPAVLLAYGKFLQNTFDFIIVAFAIFLLVKGINSLKRKQEAAPAAPPAQEVLLTEIRDLLKAQKS